MCNAICVASKNKSVQRPATNFSLLLHSVSPNQVLWHAMVVKKTGKFSWITVYAIYRCFLLCKYSRETSQTAHFCSFQVYFCKAMRSTRTTEKRSGCPFKTRNRLRLSECRSGQETDLVRRPNIWKFSKAFLRVLCYRFKLQMANMF